MQGVERIGHVFYFAPFEWLFLLTEERGVFYAEVRQITFQSAVILAIAMSVSLALLFLFAKYLTRPVYAIFRAMEDVITSKDLSKRVTVEYPDEIGGLAYQFNTMIGELEDAYDHVKNFAIREASARKSLAQREYETLTILGKAAEYRDPETGAHIHRVGYYSRMLANALGQTEHDQDLIFYASPLHDIGKLGIPDAILLKPGKLTPEEFEIIKNHTLIAGNILQNARSPYLQAGSIIALTHHECFDGSGYPKGLRADDIPLLGRIVGLVDVFDALISNRPYKKAWPIERALALLDEEKGRHFDPQIVELFLAREEEVTEAYKRHPEE
jgi:response regulator RpfG family c-di-GMP phosphodiesterase